MRSLVRNRESYVTSRRSETRSTRWERVSTRHVAPARHVELTRPADPTRQVGSTRRVEREALERDRRFPRPVECVEVLILRLEQRALRHQDLRIGGGHL